MGVGDGLAFGGSSEELQPAASVTSVATTATALSTDDLTSICFLAPFPRFSGTPSGTEYATGAATISGRATPS